MDHMTHEDREALDQHAGHKISDPHASHDRHAGHSVALFHDTAERVSGVEIQPVPLSGSHVGDIVLVRRGIRVPPHGTVFAKTKGRQITMSFVHQPLRPL